VDGEPTDQQTHREHEQRRFESVSGHASDLARPANK
jgi:hypothetical protein